MYALAPDFQAALKNLFCRGPVPDFNPDWLMGDEICVVLDDECGINIENALPDGLFSAPVSDEYMQAWADGLEYLQTLDAIEISGRPRDAWMWDIEKMIDRLTTINFVHLSEMEAQHGIRQ
jgi:hypothetical protein